MIKSSNWGVYYDNKPHSDGRPSDLQISGLAADSHDGKSDQVLAGPGNDPVTGGLGCDYRNGSDSLGSSDELIVMPVTKLKVHPTKILALATLMAIA